MDILSEVLGVIHLESLATTRQSTGDAAVQFRGEKSRAHIVMRGAAEYQPANGGSGQILLAGDMLLTGTQHHELVPKPTGNPRRLDTVWLTIDFKLDRASAHPLSAQLPEEILLRTEEVTDHADLLRTVDLLEVELVNRQPGTEFIALRLSEVVVVSALRRYQRVSDRGSGFLVALNDGPTRQALAAIHADPARRWQLEDLAQCAELSVGTFGERFHRLVGEPPMRYVRLWRLLTARRLLRSSADTIARIASTAGYRSAGGFSRAFRKQFGMAPSAFRRGS